MGTASGYIRHDSTLSHDAFHFLVFFPSAPLSPLLQLPLRNLHECLPVSVDPAVTPFHLNRIVRISSILESYHHQPSHPLGCLSETFFILRLLFFDDDILVVLFFFFLFLLLDTHELGFHQRKMLIGYQYLLLSASPPP